MSVDVINIDVPAFLRILELAREEVKDDTDLHDIAQRAAELSQSHVITMADYKDIVQFMRSQGQDELETIRRLGGIL